MANFTQNSLNPQAGIGFLEADSPEGLIKEVQSINDFFSLRGNPIYDQKKDRWIWFFTAKDGKLHKNIKFKYKKVDNVRG